MSAPDKPLKEGSLHVKQNKFGKKWKRCYVLLYPDSAFGVARLEFYDWKEGTVTGEKILARRTADRKVVRLAECIHVAPAPTENGHKENMAAFIIGTSDKTMLLSTERALCDDWIQRLSEAAFQGKNIDGKSSQEKMLDAGDCTSLEMAVNSIYFCREEASEFRVTVQRTEAAERCLLRGSYLLRAETDCLLLKDLNTKETLYSWPYKLLRRYGRDKVMFSFEAGRRCSSGPGNFTFETSQGHEIFQKVESSIRAQQGPENRLSFPSLDTDSSTDNTSLSSDPGASDVQAVGGSSRKEADDKAFKSRLLPNLPSVKPTEHFLDPFSHGTLSGKSNTPPRSPVSQSISHQYENNEHIGVYSEPKDSVKGVKPHFDPLYSDPVDSVVRKDLRSKDMNLTSPLYSDLYDKFSYEVVGGGVTSKALAQQRGEEHIYDEPEGIGVSPVSPQLYSEVRVEAAAWRKQSSDPKIGCEHSRNQPRSRTGPKPVPAPKPQGKLIPKLPVNDGDLEKISAHPHVSQTNSNNNNNSNMEPVYSQVIKPGLANVKELKAKSTPPLPLPTKPQCLPPLPPTVKTPSTLAMPSTRLQSTPGLPPPNSMPPQSLPPHVRPEMLITPHPDKEIGVQSLSKTDVSPLVSEMGIPVDQLTLIYEDLGVL